MEFAWDSQRQDRDLEASGKQLNAQQLMYE